MGGSTTTSKITLLDNGIVINKLFTKSAFKEAYILEQGLQLDHLCEGQEKPLLLDISKVQSSMDEVQQMIKHNKFYSAQCIAVLIKSSIQQKLLSFWLKILPANLPVKFFINKDKAMLWLEKTQCFSHKEV